MTNNYHGLQFQEMDYVIASVENMKEAVRVRHCHVEQFIAVHTYSIAGCICSGVLDHWMYILWGTGYEVYSPLRVL